MFIEKTSEEVDELCNRALDAQMAGKQRWPGQSYEDGIVSTIDWLTGITEDHPYPEETETE